MKKTMICPVIINTGVREIQIGTAELDFEVSFDCLDKMEKTKEITLRKLNIKENGVIFER